MFIPAAASAPFWNMMPTKKGLVQSGKKAETEIQYCELDLYSFAFLRSPQTGELAAACKFSKSFVSVSGARLW